MFDCAKDVLSYHDDEVTLPRAEQKNMRERRDANRKRLKEGLKKAGYYKGDTTGVFNADTRKALKEYQKSNKLPVTGRLSNDVLAKLKSS